MVVSSKPILENSSHIKTCKPHVSDDHFSIDIPVIDMLDPQAKFHITKACQEFGFFKVVNHDVPKETITKLEGEAVKFFNLPQCEKDKAGPANPFGYGNKRIGTNGDVGWIEYLLFSTNSELISEKSVNIPGNSHLFWCAVNEYVSGVRNIACLVLEMIAEGLKIEPKNVLSKLLRDQKSDSCFRLNHYRPCTQLEALSGGRNLIGFGEHTDPQVISVLRSNNTTGLQICLKDGTWVSVPPDHYSFFIIVGDSLQVMTNGRFWSVRHRVLANSLKSRLSMIYFGGPPLSAKIAPLSSLMEAGEESLYEEFTWGEYKKSAYLTRLGDNRLGLFEKKIKIRQYGHNLLI
ncbi:gibberellin 2-beta-dioxygenase 1-like [Nicotiana tomentosiformis]|uniref:gibberellin 2-beta-dioxygenase 1-like n=1 Tax=Nicotiana tomentosiformis TaxID=4098 RepID=UPI00051C6B63|nr:gibberellin 2-beta-dioxygenase 1-like [Nicotiana tomentosiformis]